MSCSLTSLSWCRAATCKHAPTHAQDFMAAVVEESSLHIHLALINHIRLTSAEVLIHLDSDRMLQKCAGPPGVLPSEYRLAFVSQCGFWGLAVSGFFLFGMCVVESGLPVLQLCGHLCKQPYCLCNPQQGFVVCTFTEPWRRRLNSIPPETGGEKWTN